MLFVRRTNARSRHYAIRYWVDMARIKQHPNVYPWICRPAKQMGRHCEKCNSKDICKGSIRGQHCAWCACKINAFYGLDPPNQWHIDHRNDEAIKRIDSTALQAARLDNARKEQQRNYDAKRRYCEDSRERVKAAARDASRRWRANNKERANATLRKSYANNIARRLAYRKRYYEANKERSSAYARARRAAKKKAKAAAINEKLALALDWLLNVGGNIGTEDSSASSHKESSTAQE